MLNQYLRIFTKTGAAALVDVSLTNQSKSGILVDFDTMYIGQHLPFVNLFFLMGIVNDANTNIVIEHYQDGAWVPFVDKLDGSNGLKQSGLLQFTLKNQSTWQKFSETDAATSGIPADLQGLNINECYWLRITFTGVVPNPLTSIKRICYAFTTTDTVNSVDINAPEYYPAFFKVEAGKNNWINEIITASEAMVNDLKAMGFIQGPGQVIELDEIYLACAHKTLAHIYFQLGKAYAEKRLEALRDYKTALSSRALTFDKNKNGKIDTSERNTTSTRLIR